MIAAVFVIEEHDASTSTKAMVTNPLILFFIWRLLCLEGFQFVNFLRGLNSAISPARPSEDEISLLLIVTQVFASVKKNTNNFKETLGDKCKC